MTCTTLIFCGSLENFVDFTHCFSDRNNPCVPFNNPTSQSMSWFTCLQLESFYQFCGPFLRTTNCTTNLCCDLSCQALFLRNNWCHNSELVYNENFKVNPAEGVCHIIVISNVCVCTCGCGVKDYVYFFLSIWSRGMTSILVIMKCSEPCK